jgi:hypothetical protein
LLYQRQYPEVKTLLKEILATLLSPQHKLMLRHKPRWLRLVFRALFIFKDYRTVRQLAFEIKANAPDNPQDRNFYVGVALFSLFAKLEERDEYIGRAIEETRKWFLEIDSLGGLEIRILDFVQAISSERNGDLASSLLIGLKNDVELIFKNPLEWQSGGAFPILAWIQSKLGRQELKDILFSEQFKSHQDQP